MNEIRGEYICRLKKVNVKDEINKRLENDAELKKAYDCAQLEYEVLKQLVKMRKEMGFSQVMLQKIRINTANGFPD